MIWQPEFTDKTLSRKTGAVQSGKYPQGHLHHKCYRISPSPVQETDQNQRRFSEWKQSVEAALSGTAERTGEMDNAHPELEFDIVAASHLFWRAAE